MPPGEHKISVDGRDFGTVKIDGQYAVVPLRFYESVALVGEVGSLGKLPAQEPPPPPPAAEPVKSKAVSVKKKTQTSAKKPEAQTKTK